MTLRSDRPRRVPLLVGCLVLLSLAWLVTPQSSTPPLYDGVGFPDQPYLYLVPPPGYATKGAPSVAEDDEPVYHGTVSDLLPISQESGPQAQMEIPAARLAMPPGTTQVVAKATPVPLGTGPGDGTVWGNVYRLTVTSDRGPVVLRDGQSPLSQVILRAPTAAQPGPTMEYRPPGGAWQQLHTTRAGNDIYQSGLPGLGDYALVRLAAPGKAAPRSGGTNPLVWVLGGAVVALAAAVLAVRRRRSREDEPVEDGE
ncbi:hypothetical protein [Streptacidiphilus sp. EB129]|uniref:hypothetical protein n=1 Tax=Streptacidiphilus sp. EB129 TaxID=3156262 RepID=UPI003514B9FC